MVNKADLQESKPIDNIMDNKEENVINQQQEPNKTQAVMEWLLGKSRSLFFNKSCFQILQIFSDLISKFRPKNVGKSLVFTRHDPILK